MTDQQKSLPQWIFIVSGLFAFMELMVSVYICVSPESILETVDLSAKGVYYLVYMWASRQFALGCVFAFATLKKSIPMLTIAYIFLFVMFVGDCLIGIVQKETPLIISAIVMCIISLTILYFLNKQSR